MKKVVFAATAMTVAASVLTVTPSTAAPVAATKATYGAQCKTLKAVAKGKGADGSNLVCKKETAGTYKGKQIWAYATYPTLKELEFKLGAGPTSGYAGFANDVAKALKTEGLVSGNVTNVSVIGGSGSAALNEFILKDEGAPGKALVTGYAMLLGVQNNNNRARVSNTIGVARLMAEYEAVVVNASSDIKDGKGLVAAIQANPKIAIAGGSVGTLDHATAIQMYKAIGVDSKSLNYVPHSGGGEVVTSLLSGATSIGISGWGEFEQYVNAGKLRIIGITAAKRQPKIPSATLKEQGVDVVTENWRGIMLPPETSDANTNLVIRTIDVMHASKTWQDILVERNWGDNYLVGSAWEKALRVAERQVVSLYLTLGL